MSLFFIWWRKERKRMEIVETAGTIHQFSRWPCLDTSVFAIRSCYQGSLGEPKLWLDLLIKILAWCSELSSLGGGCGSMETVQDDSGGGFDSIVVFHVLQSSLLARSLVPRPWRLFSQGEAWEGGTGGRHGMPLMRRSSFRSSDLLLGMKTVMWYHHYLACPAGVCLPVLEVCLERRRMPFF